MQGAQGEERSLEDKPRRWWSASQEERFHQKPTFPDLDLGLLRNDMSVAEAVQPVLFCAQLLHRGVKMSLACNGRSGQTE